MATACLNKNGSSKGPSSINQFHCVAQLGYGTRYNFGYPMYYRYYVRCSACATANFATSLKTSWGNTSVRLSGVGDFASTGWKSLGNKTCGTSVTLSAAWAKYTGGSGITYNSASSSGSWTVPKASHTVAYNMNGGSGTIASQTKTYGAVLTLSSTKPTRTGYTFKGWSTSSTATSATYSAGGQYSADQWGGTVTLYAVWSINSYTLYINPKGGYRVSDGSTETIEVTKNYGATETISERRRTGYTFTGWVWTTYGMMTNHKFPCSVLSGNNHGISVYNNSANGSVTHTLNLNTTDKPEYSNDYITITKSTTTASPGLGGFYQQVTPAYNTTYYHVFYAKLPTGYYFSYHNNAQPTGSVFTWLTDTAGTGSWKMYGYKLVTGSSGSTGTFGFIAANANSGSSTVAVTWYLGANQVTVAPATSSTFTTGAGNTWLYATWIPNRYTVAYNKNASDATGSMSSVTHTYDESKTLTANAFSRTGYNFAGWNTKADGSGTAYANKASVKNLTSTSGGTVTLYAQWTPWTHTVAYNGNADGVTNIPANQTKTYGSVLTLSSTKPERPGYLFQGWATSSTGAVAYAAGGQYGADQNGGTVTLYAVWLVATKIEMNLTANSGGYTISNTDAGVASLPDLTVDFTLTTVSENANLSFYYKPFYYTKENVKMYFFSDVQGGQTPSNMANKGSFVLTGTQIKEYILATENCKNIVLGVDTWTAEIVEDTYKVANSSSYSVAINNYTLPVVDILTAHRTSTSAIKVRVQVDYPACYSINTSTCKPVLTFNDSSISTAPSGAEKFDTRVIYTYNLDSLSGAGLLKASYTDGLFSDESIRRIAATLEEQEFEIQEDIIYALEFIEN